MREELEELRLEQLLAGGAHCQLHLNPAGTVTRTPGTIAHRTHAAADSGQRERCRSGPASDRTP